jgi:hypothetical protein
MEERNQTVHDISVSNFSYHSYVIFVSCCEIRISFHNVLFIRLCAATVTLPSFISSVKYSVGYMDSLSPIPVTWAVHLAFLAFAFLIEPSDHRRQTPELKVSCVASYKLSLYRSVPLRIEKKYTVLYKSQIALVFCRIALIVYVY